MTLRTSWPSRWPAEEQMKTLVRIKSPYARDPEPGNEAYESRHDGKPYGEALRDAARLLHPEDEE